MTLAIASPVVNGRFPKRRDADLPGLGLHTLKALPAWVRRPRYDVGALRTGIVHLGCGSFHRAHQAVITQRAIEAENSPRSGPPPWGIAAASLRTGAVVASLARQQGLYTVVECGPDRWGAEVVGSLREPLDAMADPERLQALMSHPRTHLITLTVTEAGYGADPATGRLDLHDADVAADLGGRSPHSTPGLIVEGLRRRRAAGTAPPVLMSCDNLPGNGALLRQVCLDMAASRSDGLAAWVERHVQFPSSVVDRIVPEPSDDDRRLASRLVGVRDRAPVTTEPFSQWVIDRFDGPRPLWEAGGAQFVDDVAPWEASKLRLLNGGHLAIACLGMLAGFETVAEAMAEPLLCAYARRLLVEEQRSTLPPSDHDIVAYAGQLIARWRNPAIAHRLDRIVRNSSAKLQARLLTGLSVHLDAGRPAPLTVLALAAWIWCASGRPHLGRAVPAQDHLQAELSTLGRACGGDAKRLVKAFLGLREIFGDDLPSRPQLARELVRAVQRLRDDGPLGALRAALHEPAPA